MLHAYTTNTNPSYLVENVKCILTAAIGNCRSLHQLMVRIEALLQDNASLTSFKEFVNRMANLLIEWHKKMLFGVLGHILCLSTVIVTLHYV